MATIVCGTGYHAFARLSDGSKAQKKSKISRALSGSSSYGAAVPVAGNGAINLKGLIDDAKEKLLSALVQVLFKPQDKPNIYFQENFSPVAEVGSWVPVHVIEGEVPRDFPAGTYIRNGPNPFLASDKIVGSPFGKLMCHWFEGDGMLHATRFDKGGRSITYTNKYVNTIAHEQEVKTKTTSFLDAFEGDPLAIQMSYLFNFLRFGKFNAPTCNTQIFKLAGKLYATAEGDVPHEIDPSDLTTLGTVDFDGEWTRPFGSHPKVDTNTDELVIYGFSGQAPHLEIGIISNDGKLVHKTALELDRACLVHEIGITQNYNLIPDYPLTIDVNRLLKSGRLVEFESNSYAKIGIMPRYGDSESVRWFHVEPGFSFHVVNSYEDGDEVVLHALHTRTSFIPTPADMDRHEWFARAVTPTDPETAKNPDIDGALLANLREWRFNLDKGTVVERNLTSLKTSGIEMPTINRMYTGKKNQFAYAQVTDVDASKTTGMPKFGKLMKVKLPASSKDEIEVRYHDLGANRFGSEPFFVARPNAIEEDDGWIVSYVHDEKTNKSEVHILDAQKFEDKPVARIEMPQRVPYGFHSDFFYATDF